MRVALLLLIVFAVLSKGRKNEDDDLEDLDLERYLDDFEDEGGEEPEARRRGQQQQGDGDEFDLESYLDDFDDSNDELPQRRRFEEEDDEEDDEGMELTEADEREYMQQTSTYEIEGGHCFIIPAFEVGCDLSVSCHSITGALPKLPANTECLWIRESFGLTKLSMEEKKGFWSSAGLNKGVLRLLQIEGGLGDLPEDFFKGFTQLRFLNLEANKFVTLPERLFDDLTNLKVLYLTGNHIQPDEGEELYQLYKKNGNQLKSLEENQFKTMKNIKILLLHHNQLTSLPNTVFQNNRVLMTLKLIDNKFKPALKYSHPALTIFNPKKMQLDLKRDTGDGFEDELLKTGQLLDKTVDPFYLENIQRQDYQDKMEL